MGETTIAWTDFTLNPWIGCSKVSAGCAHCYAEHSPPVRTARARGLELWGSQAERHETKGWLAELRRWDRAAFRDGVRRRVFCASLADVFEDHPALPPIRARLFDAIERTTALDFQLLTKRPENIMRMVPPSWIAPPSPHRDADAWWPRHVWIGTTCEDQRAADERIPHLLRVPARVRFLSVEPQIGPVVIQDHLPRYGCAARCHHHSDRAQLCGAGGILEFPSIRWVICGGESGPKARPFDLAWARSLRDQCRAAGVAYFFKQAGANAHQSSADAERFGSIADLCDSHGADESEWPEDMRGCRAFPEVARG